MENLLTEIDTTTTDLLATIQSFNQDEFNEVPFEGSWTAGQVAEHVLKSEAGLTQIWCGHTKETERQADQNAATIEGIFLDFSTKMKSPEFILPSNGPHNNNEIYDAIKINRSKIKELATSIDLNKTFTDFAFPQMGALTGIEWATFIICHSKRHIHQMQVIKSAV